MADEPQEPTLKAIEEYDDSKDAVAVLSTVIVPLAGIGLAVFGIKQGAEAKAETKQVKKEAQRLANSLDSAPDGGGGGGGVPAEQVDRVKRRLRSLGQ
jgi:hypothetical protein